MQRLAIDIDQDHHEQNGQRQGRPHDQGAAPAHDQEQDGEDDQGGKAQILRQSGQAVDDIVRLGHDDLDLDGRIGRPEVTDDPLGARIPRIHLQFGLQIARHQDGAAIVDIGFAGCRLTHRSLDPRDVVNAHEAAWTLRHRDVPDPVQRVKGAINLDIDIKRLTRQTTGRQLGVRSGQEAGHFDRAQAQR